MSVLSDNTKNAFSFLRSAFLVVSLLFAQKSDAQIEASSSPSSPFDCRSSPCVHGICLVEAGNVQRFRCLCQLGFTGSHCQLNYDECSLNLCRNNATCEDLVGDFRCHCLPGFTGN